MSEHGEPSDPPQIETVEGVGAEYLAWTRDVIFLLLERVEDLEARVAELGS